METALAALNHLLFQSTGNTIQPIAFSAFETDPRPISIRLWGCQGFPAIGALGGF